MIELVPRHLTPVAEEALTAFPALVVQGARQVGKSTFAQLIAQARPSRILTLDDERALAASDEDPRAFVEQASDGLLVIDELQRSPGLLLAIKASIDRDRRPGRFLLTGSSDLLRLEQTPDSLAGRAATVHLRGLSQGELAQEKDDFVTSWLTPRKRPDRFTTAETRDGYIARLSRGGYPELQDLTGRLRATWLDSYVSRIIQRDAREIHRLTQPERLRSLLRLLAANQSGELVKARLAADAGIPATTITSYLDVLATLFLVDAVPPWTPNLTRREVGKPKAVVSDSAVAMRLGRVTDQQLGDPAGSNHLGGLLEGFVVSELLKQSGWSAHPFELFHFRDRNGLEVDLVIELEDGTVIGVEVKAARTFKADHFSGLKRWSEMLGSRFRGGVVLNTGDSGYQFSRDLWGLPIAALWEW